MYATVVLFIPTNCSQHAVAVDIAHCISLSFNKINLSTTGKKIWTGLKSITSVKNLLC